MFWKNVLSLCVYPNSLFVLPCRGSADKETEDPFHKRSCNAAACFGATSTVDDSQDSRRQGVKVTVSSAMNQPIDVVLPNWGSSVLGLEAFWPVQLMEAEVDFHSWNNLKERDSWALHCGARNVQNFYWVWYLVSILRKK